MTYAEFVLTVPAWVRFLIALTLTVGIALGFVAALHRRIIWLNDEGRHRPPADDKKPQDEGPDSVEDEGPDSVEVGKAATEQVPTPPEMFYLSGRIMSVTTMAFVFLLAFALGNLWTNHRAAEQATQAEVGDLTRVAAAARYLPPAQSEPILAAVETYATTVREVEWSLMQAGDGIGTGRAHGEAAGRLVEAAADAVANGAEDNPAWSPLSSALDDLLTNSSNRISQVPVQRTASIVLLVCFLGIANLAMIAAFQPTRLRNNLFLIGVLAAITATLMFVLVESSNPYLGSGAIDADVFAQVKGD